MPASEVNVEQKNKELESELEYVRALRRKERDIIDIMGHELRTPVVIVKMNVDIVDSIIKTSSRLGKSTMMSRKLAKYICRIKEASEREIRLINSLLFAAKIEGENILLNLEEVDVVAIIKKSLSEHRFLAKNKQIKLELIKEDADIFSACADKEMVKQIIDNLVQNAIKYTNKGFVKIFIKNLNQESIQISVEDSGIGIQSKYLHRLGEKFFRVPRCGKVDTEWEKVVQPGGTGLGLYVVFGLIQEHGGEINVESEPKKGSRFIFTLPVFKKKT